MDFALVEARAFNVLRYAFLFFFVFFCVLPTRQWRGQGLLPAGPGWAAGEWLRAWPRFGWRELSVALHSGWQ